MYTLDPDLAGAVHFMDRDKARAILDLWEWAEKTILGRVQQTPTDFPTFSSTGLIIEKVLITPERLVTVLFDASWEGQLQCRCPSTPAPSPNPGGEMPPAASVELLLPPASFLTHITRQDRELVEHALVPGCAEKVFFIDRDKARAILDVWGWAERTILDRVQQTSTDFPKFITTDFIEHMLISPECGVTVTFDVFWEGQLDD